VGVCVGVGGGGGSWVEVGGERLCLTSMAIAFDKSCLMPHVNGGPFGGSPTHHLQHTAGTG
jgi:hypothetical protein